MTIRLPPSKAPNVKPACENLLSKTKVTIRELAHVIGLLVSSLPGVQFGCLHYRQLEKDKSRALQLCKGNYDGPVTLSDDSRSELEWWVNNVTSSFMPITQDKPDFILTTDASKIGWEAVCGDHKTGGCWDLDEQQYHINYLESKDLSHYAVGRKTNIFALNQMTPPQWPISMPWVALNLLTVMTWPSKSGNGVLRGTFGLVLPTFLAVLMLRQIKSLGRLTTPQNGHYL